MAGWVDLLEVSALWADAPDDPTTLNMLLDAAYEQCAAFAPALAAGALVPERYKLAQVMQARALYRSTLAGSGDQIGADGVTVTVFPMDATVKALLRPRRGWRVL